LTSKAALSLSGLTSVPDGAVVVIRVASPARCRVLFD
jgi:hypothetical protein